MSVEAYILIECDHGKAWEVQERLLKIAGVKDARVVTGPYDIITLVIASNFKNLGEVLVTKIQALKYVKKTLTNVVME